MSDEELAKVIAELDGKSDEEINSHIETNSISGEDAEIILEAIDALKDLVEEKADVPPESPLEEKASEEAFEEKPAEETAENTDSGADDTLTENLSDGAETVDTDGDGDKDAVVIDEEKKHGDEDNPHDKGIRPKNILEAISALRF